MINLNGGIIQPPLNTTNGFFDVEINYAAFGGGSGGNEAHVDLSLTTPNADDKALLVSVTGAGTGDSLSNVVLANSSYSMYSRNENGRALKAAFFGNLANGALLQFNVPDVNRVASYNVAVVEAADGTRM